MNTKPNPELNPPPHFVTVDHATGGQKTIHISITGAADCRAAALWLLDIADRLKNLGLA